MSIRVEGLTKVFNGKVVLKDLTWEVPTGSFSTVLAPTGSGKTTLLRILAGVERPTSGRVFYDGVDVTKLPVQKRDISMVYQQFINYPSLSVYENIASPIRIANKKIAKGELDTKVQRIAKLLKITHVLDHLPAEVSGGEQQRTAIARALVKGSRFIFLDEPLGNLDYKLREELRGELKTVFKGSTIVYATPEPVDALSMSSHVGFLSGGKIVQFGPVDEVYRDPGTVDVGYHFSDPPMNLMPAVKEQTDKGVCLRVSETVTFPVGDVASSLPGQDYIVGVRPQDVSADKPIKHSVSFEATVEFTEIVGSSTTLHLSHTQEVHLGATIDKLSKPFETGEKIHVYVNVDRIFIYDAETRRLVAARGVPIQSHTTSAVSEGAN